MTSELSCSLSEGREETQCFQSWLLCFIAAAFSTLVWPEELWGVADNGCSHFPAVRYLMTLTPQPLGFFTDLIYFFSLWHSQLKCFQQPDTPKPWPHQCPSSLRDPALPGCPPAAKGFCNSLGAKC